MFYIGRMGQQWGRPNWIETYEVVDKTDAMQYMHLGSPWTSKSRFVVQSCGCGVQYNMLYFCSISA